MPDRRVSVGIDADISPYQRKLLTATADTKAFVRELESADGRLANMVQTGLALAPAFVPLGATAVPAIAGLTLELGLAAGAAGVAVLALHGVGDALKALDNYQSAPTAENFAKLNQELDKLGPAGQEFVLAIDKMKPQLQDLQDVAEAGLLPGVTDGLADLIRLSPEVEQVLYTISSALGDLARDAGEGLDDAGLERFFDYIQTTARPVLTEMGHTLGNLVEGIANTIVAVDPLSRSFSTGLLELSERFKTASENLDDSAGFQDFVDYIQTSGPRALNALEAIGNALVQLIEAAAPVGSAVLPVIETLADSLAAVANSPAGPVIIGVAAAIGTLGRSMALLKAVGLLGDGRQGLLATALDVDSLKSAPAAISASAAATRELAAAEKARATAHAEYLGALRASSTRIDVIPGAGPSDGAISATDRLVAANKRQVDAATAVKDAEAKKASALRGSASAVGKSVAVVGGLAVANSNLAESSGLSNTASLALMGTIAGPWGAALGAGIGIVEDLASANNDLERAGRAADDAFAGDNFLKQAQTLKTVTAETEKYQAAVDRARHGASSSFSLFDPSSYSHLKDQFVSVGDLFTHSSEERTAKNKQEAEQLAHTESAYRALADAVGQRLPADASPQQIQDFVDKVTPALQKAGISAKDLVNDGYDGLVRAGAAVTGYFAALDSATGKSQAVSDALSDLGNEMETNVDQAKDLGDALDNLFGVQLSQSAATDAAIESLKKLGEALRKARGLDLTATGPTTAPQVLAARSAIRDYISAQLDRVKADAAADGSGRRAAQTLLDTRANIIATAKAAGAGKGEIRDLLAQMGLAPKNLKTVIETPGLLTAKEQVRALSRLLGLTPEEVRTQFHLDGAQSALDQGRNLQHLLNDIDGTTATTYVKVVTTGSAEGPAAYANTPKKPKRRADGGRVDGPGGPTDDVIPAWLSNGEYVIQASAVDRYGAALFDSFNAMRFAGGGFVGTDFVGGYNGVSSTLEFLQQEQQIRQLQADLNEKVKKGKHKGEYVIRGADRDEKLAELQKANLDLEYLRHKTAYDQAAARAAQDAQDTQDAADRQSQLLAAQQQTSQSLFGTLSLFGRGASAFSADVSARRFEQDVNDYADALQALIDAGAGYGILVNVEKIADQGDFRTAARVAKNLASNPLIVGDINSTLARVQVKTQAIAGLTTGSAFQLGYIGTTQGTSTLNMPINFFQDPSYLATEIARVVDHKVDAALSMYGNQP